MKIRIAHETPTQYIEYTQRITDYDFAIASMVLKNKFYAGMFARRAAGRLLILDNGFFEDGAPQSSDELLAAADLVRADYVVAPDVLGDKKKTLELYEPFMEKFASPKYRLAAVVVGSDAKELVECYEYYAKDPRVDMYCWAFGSDRREALRILRHSARSAGVDTSRRHHLFGFRTLEELAACVSYLEEVDEVTIDTSKPASAAFAGKQLEDLGRKAYARPDWNQALDPGLLSFNIGVFRGWMQSVARAPEAFTRGA